MVNLKNLLLNLKVPIFLYYIIFIIFFIELQLDMEMTYLMVLQINKKFYFRFQISRKLLYWSFEIIIALLLCSYLCSRLFQKINVGASKKYL